MQRRIGRKQIYTSAAALFRVRRSENNFSESGHHNRAGTHRARFQRNIQRTVIQAPVTLNARSFPQAEHLRVRGRILGPFTGVMRRADDFPVSHQRRADRYFTLGQSLFRFRQRELHRFHLCETSFAFRIHHKTFRRKVNHFHTVNRKRLTSGLFCV